MDSSSTDGRTLVYVCLNEDCCKRGSETIYGVLKAQTEEMQDVEVREYICFGNCDYGVNSVVFPDRVWFSGLRKDDAGVVLEYLRSGVVPEEHAGNVDEELADTTWELLELDTSDEDESVADSRAGAGAS